MDTFLGADVVEFRRRRGLSRKALAASCGLTEGKIWRIENKGKISAEEQRALQLVGVTSLGEYQGDASDTLGPVITLPRPTPPPPPVALLGINEPWSELRDLPPQATASEINLADLARFAEKKYDRYLSNSELRTFKRCRRKWWLGWHRGLRLKKESPVGVRQVGTRLHLALKAHYTPSDPVDMLAELERYIIIDRTLLDANGESELVRAQFENEANLERIMLEGYLEWLAETGADAELVVDSAETYVEAGLVEFDEKVAIIGKMDVRVRRTLDNVRLFIDHKSVASLVQPTLMLALDEQMLHYHLLELLTTDEDGPRSDGALYNMLRRVKRTAKATPPFFARVEVRHNKHELASYRRRMVGTISDILEVEESLEKHGASHQTVAYPNPTRDCTWDCPFIAVCPMFDDGSRVEGALTEYYTVGDPLDYYQNEVLGGTE